MMSYETILLAAALQRWERYSAHALAAREIAATVARGSSRPLHVLSVYEYEPMPVPSAGLPSDMTAKLRDEEIRRTDEFIARKMDEYLEPLLADGLKLTKILRLGDPREAIVQVATEIGADLLIIGSHSKRGLFDIAIGGTAQRVIKHAPCTVVLVSPTKGPDRGAASDPGTVTEVATMMS